MKLLNLNKQKRVKSINFFDLSSSEKKKIIKKAAKDSTEEQIKLLKKNGYVFNFCD